MIKLLRYIKPYRTSAALGMFFKFAETVLEVLLPVIMAQLISHVIAAKGFDGEAIKLLLAMAIIIPINIVMALLGQYFATRSSVMFGRDLRRNLFDKINSLSYSGLNNFGTSSLTNRLINDTLHVQNAVFWTVRVGMRAPFLAIGSFIMALVLDVGISMVFLFTIPIISIVLFYIIRRTISMYDELAVQLDNVTMSATENYSGQRVIRSYSAQDRELKRYKAQTGNYCDSAIRVGRLSALLHPAATFVMQLGIVIILYLGGNKVYSGALEPPQITAFITYMLQILLALMVLANLIVLFTRGTASANRINAVFDSIETEDVGGTADCKCASFATCEDLPKDTPHIKYCNVGFGYDGTTEIIKDISFSIERGQTFGIIGATGSGKTTLINLLPRFYNTGRGSIYISGKDIADMQLSSLRKMIGVVPQKTQLFKGTIRSNINMGDESITDDDIEWALKVAQGRFALRHADKLSRVVEQGGSNYSGGQRQRLCIARAIAKRPEILILDDSSSALDFKTDAALFRAVRKNLADVTTIIISQRIFSIMRADKILVLQNGTAVGYGTHTQLLQTCDVYKQIYNSQISQ